MSLTQRLQVINAGFLAKGITELESNTFEIFNSNILIRDMHHLRLRLLEAASNLQTSLTVVYKEVNEKDAIYQQLNEEGLCHSIADTIYDNYKFITVYWD